MKVYKKAQVTIFIILAIVILIGAGTYLFLAAQDTEAGLTGETKIKEKIPVEFDPVKNYVTECAQKTLQQGLLKIGQTGGYASIDEPELNGNANLADGVLPLTKESKNKVVYWRYYTGTQLGSKQPPLYKKDETAHTSGQSIESQLGKYVALKIENCLNDFAEFTAQGFTVERTGTPSSTATVGESDISILLTYPLKVHKTGSTVDMTQFFVKTPLPLHQIYQLAADITALENEHGFFERNIKTILSLYAGDNPRPAPLDDYYFTYTPKFWIRSEVEKNLRDIVQQQFMAFKMEPETNADADRFYGIPMTGAQTAVVNDNNLNVRFSYLSDGKYQWPFTLDMCGKEICQAQSCSGIVPFPCQRMHTVYSLHFPVLVEITQQSSFDTNKYTFRFFLQSYLKDNEPLQPQLTALSDLSGLGASSLSAASKLCEKATWNSPPITLTIKDAASKKEIPNTLIYYSVTGESCLVGTTDQKGILTSSFPQGTVGGVLLVSHQDYIGKSAVFDAGLVSAQTLDIELEPLHTLKLRVEKRKFTKLSDWVIESGTAPLARNEKAVVILTRKPADTEEEHTVFSEFAGHTQSEEFPNITIAQGTYEANIQLISNDIVAIPKSEACGSFLGFDVGCTEIPEINFGVLPDTRTHVAIIKNFPQGTQSYTLKCVDKSKVNQNSPDTPALAVTTVQLSGQRNAQAQFGIESKTPSEFKSADGYIAVQTSHDAVCRARDVSGNKETTPPNEERNGRKGYENYEEMVTEKTIHILTRRFKEGTYTFDVICKKSDEQTWELLEPKIMLSIQSEYGTQLPEDADGTPEDKRPLEIPGFTDSRLTDFSGDVALLPLQTSQQTSCMYAAGATPKETDFKPLGIPKDTQFIAGGFKGEVLIPNPDGKKELVLYVLDMGLDDIPQYRRTVDDLEHWKSVDDKSKAYSSILAPEVR